MFIIYHHQIFENQFLSGSLGNRLHGVLKEVLSPKLEAMEKDEKNETSKQKKVPGI